MARKRSEMNDAGSQPPANDKRSRPRITVYLDADGRPDLEALSEEQRQALGIGYEPPPPPPPPEKTDPATVRLAIGFLSTIEAQILASRLELPIGEIQTRVTPPEQFMSKMSEAGARVLDKYGSFLSKWADEIALGAMFVTWQMGALGAVRSYRAQIEREREQSSPQTYKPETTVPVPPDPEV